MMATRTGKPTTLEEVAERMRALEGNGDFEMAHGDADDLLIEALLVMADSSRRPAVIAIVESYNRVGKWYA